MSDTSSETLHETIQRALTIGDFDKTRQLSGELGRAIIREVRSVPSEERAALVEQGLSRLKEHLNLARVLRAHVAARLQENTALSLYQDDYRRGNSWQFDG